MMYHSDKGVIAMSNDNHNKKRGSILCAAVVIAVLGILLGFILMPLVNELAGALFAVGFLLVYGGVIIAVIAGVIVALNQRLREIDSGEEEEAKKY